MLTCTKVRNERSCSTQEEADHHKITHPTTPSSPEARLLGCGTTGTTCKKRGAVSRRKGAIGACEIIEPPVLRDRRTKNQAQRRPTTSSQYHYFWVGFRRTAAVIACSHARTADMAADDDSSGEGNTLSDGDRARTDPVECPVKPESEDTDLQNALGGKGGEQGEGALPPKAGPGEFDLLKVIGMGAFGKVLQVCIAPSYLSLEVRRINAIVNVAKR